MKAFDTDIGLHYETLSQLQQDHMTSLENDSLWIAEGLNIINIVKIILTSWQLKSNERSQFFEKLL